MPLTKTTYFDQEQNRLANLAKALAHPARIAILQVLMEQDNCVCNDIVGQLPLAQATVSQHLKVLKEAGLVKGDISPNRSCYCIDPEGWKAAKDLLGGFFNDFSGYGQDLCCE